MTEARDFVIAFIAGGIALLASHALAAWIRRRRLRDLEAEPQRTPLVALSYDTKPGRDSDQGAQPGAETVVACLLLALRPGIEPWQIALCIGFALLGVQGAWYDLHDLARKVTVRPVIAAQEEGLYLTGWSGTVFLPWREIALAWTEPPDTGGYVAAEQKVTFHVESRSGRCWCFSSRDFAVGAPAEFDRLVELVILRTAPPDSMLTRGRL